MKKKVKEENTKNKKEVYPADANQLLKEKKSKRSVMRIQAGFAPDDFVQIYSPDFGWEIERWLQQMEELRQNSPMKSKKMTFVDTHFEIDKDTPVCCCDFTGMYLDFNYNEAKIGDRLACKTCRQVYELKMSLGVSPELYWCKINHY